MNILNLPRFEVGNEQGVILVRDGFVISFFVSCTHSEIKFKVLECLKAFLELPKPTSLLWGLDEYGYPTRLNEHALHHILEATLIQADAECNLWLSDVAFGAPRYRVQYQGFDVERRKREGWPGVCSGISFTFPTDHGGHSGILDIFEFANLVAVLLPFSFGLVSPAFIIADGSLEASGTEAASKLARRYMCLEIPSLLPDCFEGHGGPKGIYWGTYFGEPLIVRLGGLDTIHRKFSNIGARIEPITGGKLSIYLSPLPIAGDVNRREDASKYIQAFNLLRGEIPSREVSYLGFTDETFADWVNRFSAD